MRCVWKEHCRDYSHPCRLTRGGAARHSRRQPETETVPMPPKTNPLKLNKLQLKTLAILQELANDTRIARRADHPVGISH